MINRQIVLSELPRTALAVRHFQGREVRCPVPADGELLLRVLYIPLDAASRAWMHGATYRPGLVAGEVMAGLGLAEVVESRSASFQPGDLVCAETGWQTFAVVPAAGLIRLPRLEPLTHLLSVYGAAGLTAYFGLLECARPVQGETLAVSAAAGAVGSSSGRSPGSGAAVPSALREAPANAPGWFVNWVSTWHSTTRRGRWPMTCGGPVRTGSTRISTTLAVQSSMPACRTWRSMDGSPVAARFRNTTWTDPPPVLPDPRATHHQAPDVARIPSWRLSREQRAGALRSQGMGRLRADQGIRGCALRAGKPAGGSGRPVEWRELRQAHREGSLSAVRDQRSAAGAGELFCLLQVSGSVFVPSENSPCGRGNEKIYHFPAAVPAKVKAP